MTVIITFEVMLPFLHIFFWDPVAVVSLLKSLGAPKKLSTLIESESLLNDGTAFVLFVILMDFVKNSAGIW